MACAVPTAARLDCLRPRGSEPKAGRARARNASAPAAAGGDPLAAHRQGPREHDQGKTGGSNRQTPARIRANGAHRHKTRNDKKPLPKPASFPETLTTETEQLMSGSVLTLKKVAARHQREF